MNLELSRDCSGLGLLHKAVIHNHVQLQDWLIENYPATVNVLDKVRSFIVILKRTLFNLETDIYHTKLNLKWLTFEIN